MVESRALASCFYYAAQASIQEGFYHIPNLRPTFVRIVRQLVLSVDAVQSDGSSSLQQTGRRDKHPACPGFSYERT